MSVTLSNSIVTSASLSVMVNTGFFFFKEEGGGSGGAIAGLSVGHSCAYVVELNELSARHGSMRPAQVLFNETVDLIW